MNEDCEIGGSRYTLMLGGEKYTPLYFGNRISLESYEGGLNLYFAWPYNNWGNYKLFFSANNLVGIGKKPNTYSLEVLGTVYSTGSYNTSSDIRLKKNIRNISQDLCLNKLLLLKGKSYRKKQMPISDKRSELNKMLIEDKIKSKDVSQVYEAMTKSDIAEDSILHFGLIAQEVKEIYPKIVSVDSLGFMSVEYQSLIPVIIESMKEIQESINKNSEILNSLIIDNIN